MEVVLRVVLEILIRGRRAQTKGFSVRARAWPLLVAEGARCARAEPPLPNLLTHKQAGRQIAALGY